MTEKSNEVQLNESMSYQAPLADQSTLQFAVDFCIRELSTYGVQSIYLIGSRANGRPRPNSDHDIVVILSDCAPAEVTLGGRLHMKIFLKLEKQRKMDEIGPIDLITMRASHYQTTKGEVGSFANATLKGGIRLS